MSNIILLNKPFQVLCQFTTKDRRPCLADYVQRPGFYPAGRLDYDSEGLLLLTNDGHLQQRITNPRYKFPKTYWVQVEGEPSQEQLSQLAKGVELKDGRTKPAKVKGLPSHQVARQIWPRNPPIRERQQIPTVWLSLTITEGRNRQIRRMTAAVGLPTLRLIRISIGHFTLAKLAPGAYKEGLLNLPKI